MTIPREEAKQLCSGDEMKIVDASFPPRIDQLGIDELRSHVTQARRLQDKYRDLARRQNREKKGAGAVPGSKNVRTGQKEQLFVETRERFEERLGALAEEG